MKLFVKFLLLILSLMMGIVAFSQNYDPVKEAQLMLTSINPEKNLLLNDNAAPSYLSTDSVKVELLVVFEHTNYLDYLTVQLNGTADKIKLKDLVFRFSDFKDQLESHQESGNLNVVLNLGSYKYQGQFHAQIKANSSENKKSKALNCSTKH